jgi:magnesium-transporting ATPase (P-type)
MLINEGRHTVMSKKRGFVEVFVLGIADDIPSTNRLLMVSRITHWICFLVAVVAALKFANLFFGTGNLWNEPPSDTTNRQLFQTVQHQFFWLLISGISLLAGFVSWLNTDVLTNRKIMLEQIDLTGAYVGSSIDAVQVPKESNETKRVAPAQRPPG